MKKYIYYGLMGLVVSTLVGGAVALANTSNGFGIFGDGSGYERMLDSKAQVLDISVDELKVRLEDKTFPEILDEQGISHEELGDQMRELQKVRMTERLQEMVDAENITDEQMQEKLQWMEQRHEEGGGPHMMGKGISGKGMHKNFTDVDGDGVCDRLDSQDDN